MRKLKGVLIFLISSLTITGISFIDGQVWNLIFLAFGIITYAIVGILFSIGILRDRSSGKEAYAFIFIMLILAGYGFIKALKAFKTWIISLPFLIKKIIPTVIITLIVVTFLIIRKNKNTI